MGILNARGANRFASLSSLPSTAPDQLRSVRFAIAGDRASSPHDAAFNLTSAMTVELWIRPSTDLVTFPVIFTKGAVNTAITLLISAADRFQVTLKPSGAQVDVSDPNVVTRSSWQHYAFSYDGSNIRLYRDGVLVAGPTPCGAVSINSGLLYFGDSDTLNANAYAGWIDEFRVWNSVRSQAEIAGNRNVDIPPTTAGLVAYWKFNDALGTSVVDAVAGRVMTLNSVQQRSGIAPF